MMGDPAEKIADEGREGAAAIDGEPRESLSDFFAQFSGGGYQFHIGRLEPKLITVGGKQRRTSGHLDTTHTLPTPEYLKENYGGGLYEIRAMARGPKGTRFAGSRRIEIAGDARLRPEAMSPDDPPPAPAQDPAIVDKMLQDKWRSEDRTDRELRELRQQAARAAQRPPIDPVIEAIRDSAGAQVETLRLELQRRDREAAELRQQIHAGRNDRSALNDPEVLKAIFGRGSEDADRLREAHRHELAAERDRAARELAAERDRVARELEGMRRDTANQIALVERLHRSDVDNLKAAHQGLLATKDAEIARLGDELRTARSGASKPESWTEQAAKVDQFIEVSQRIASRANGAPPPDEDDEEDDDKPWYTRLFDRDGFAERVAEKVMVFGQQAPPPPTPTPTGRPQLRIVRTPIVMRDAAHATVPTDPPAAQPPAVASPVGEAQQQPPIETEVVPEGGAEGEVAPTGKLMQGLQFLETALRGGQPAGTVARAAHRLFDRAELSVLVAAGNDQLAAAIEKIAPESVLLSHGGRHYLGEFLGALKDELPPS